MTLDIVSLPLEEFIPLYENFLRKHYEQTLHTKQKIQSTLSLLDQKNPFLSRSDLHCFVATQQTTLVACAILTIDHHDKKHAKLGFYECINDQNISSTFLSHIISYAKNKQITTIQGPINLSIWHEYRYITKNQSDLYFFDPLNKSYYSNQWRAAGFVSAQQFVTATRTDYSYVLPQSKEAYEKNLKEGFSTRPFDLSCADQDLQILYDLSKEAFETNWANTSLFFSEFLYLYKPYVNKIDPTFVEIIERDHMPVAFCFSIPNPTNKSDLIVKTMVVHPNYQKHKLASMLMYSQHTKAQQQGYTKCVYPLIRKGNNVTKFPYQGYTIITEYECFDLNLDAT